MLEDQEYILTRILEVIDGEKPDAVLIAGDIYDKSVPPAEAVGLFDGFLCRLAKRRLQVFVISGNHDSPERIAFGSRLMDPSGIHLSPVYAGKVVPAVLNDGFGPVNVWMLPFLKPACVRPFFPGEKIETYTDAVRAAVQAMNPDFSQRNVLVAHQFVTGAARSESEEISVGGADNVDASVFGGFDYVALGHIHGPQNIGGGTLRYCGTPLKYSFSEAGRQKSVTVAELGEKGSVSVRTVPLVPKHDLRELRGAYMELTARSAYAGTGTDDYLHITLTDEEDIPDAVGKLRVIYPNLMKLDYDNQRTRGTVQLEGAQEAEHRSPLDLLAEFYEKQNGLPMGAEQEAKAKKLIETIWEGEE